MSRVKTNSIVSFTLLLGAIFVFSQFATKAGSHQNALNPTVSQGQILVADGTNPPPTRPTKPGGVNG